MVTRLLSAPPVRIDSDPNNPLDVGLPEIEVTLPPLDMAVIGEFEEFLAQLIASNLLAKQSEHGGSNAEHNP